LAAEQRTKKRQHVERMLRRTRTDAANERLAHTERARFPSPKEPFAKKVVLRKPRKVFAAAFTVIFYGGTNFCCKTARFSETPRKPGPLKNKVRNIAKH